MWLDLTKLARYPLQYYMIAVYIFINNGSGGINHKNPQGTFAVAYFWVVSYMYKCSSGWSYSIKYFILPGQADIQL